jgi:hypothetical protein
MDFETKILTLTHVLGKMPHTDVRTNMLYRVITRIAEMSKKTLPKGVELEDLVYTYQHIMDIFFQLKAFEDLSSLEAALVKAVEDKKLDKLEFCYH